MTGIEFALVALAGVLLGRFLPNRRKGPKPPPKPVCGCGHHHSYHDRQNGRCGHVERVYLGGGIYGQPDECTCRQYSGPEPMPEFYATELTGGEPS